ncbi:MAG: hypothetical protein WA160_12115 [Pseudobdellovibrio sp.]
MKTALILSLLTLGSFSYADCLQEAQIIAKVKAVETKTLSSCKVSIDIKSIQHFSSSQACPLSIEDVLTSTVEVGLSSGHDCRLEAGDTLTGVLVKNSAGVIVLE